MSARRQLEHGDSLSHRTLRWRQVTQLRCLAAAGCAFEGAALEGAAVACFSASENGADAPVAADIVWRSEGIKGGFFFFVVVEIDQGSQGGSSIGLKAWVFV